jgi:hypothetical protein
MNANTALVMFALIAALGLVAATVVMPIVVSEAYAQGKPYCTFSPQTLCKAFGQSHRP